jgi:hypothetical protein
VILHGDLPTPLADDAAGDAQSQPCSLTRWLRRKERLKNPGQVLGLNPPAVVLKLKDNRILLQVSCDEQITILPAVGGLHSILDQSEEKLVQLVLAHPKGGQSPQVLGLELHPCLSGAGLQETKRPFRYQRDVCLDLLGLSGRPGKISKALDHFAHPRASREAGLEILSDDIRAIQSLQFRGGALQRQARRAQRLCEFVSQCHTDHFERSEPLGISCALVMLGHAAGPFRLALAIGGGTERMIPYGATTRRYPL